MKYKTTFHSFLTFLLLTVCSVAKAQTAKPSVTFYSVDDKAEITIYDGDSHSAQAPCEITCKANLDYDENEYDKVVCEWKIYKVDEGENKPLLDRYEQDINYTIKESGAHVIKLYVTFINNTSGMTYDYEMETGASVVISDSKLIVTDGLSPNDDGLNDELVIECQSLVKVNGVIKNRWGKTLHVFNVDNIAQGWDGKVNGKPVKDGGYILHIDAIGSDGLHYKIRKVISVLNSYNSDADSSSEF